MIVEPYLAGNQDRRRVRRLIFDFADELRAVQSGHGHICDYQIDPALQEARERLFSAWEAGNAVAARFQHDLSMGKRLLVVIHAQDRSLWFHQPSGISRASITLPEKNFSRYEECQSEKDASEKKLRV